MLFSPGHRPPASEALGWSLPTRWAGGRFSDKAPRNLRARKAERRTSRTPRTAGTRKYRTGYRRSAFEVLAVLVVLGACAAETPIFSEGRRDAPSPSTTPSAGPGRRDVSRDEYSLPNDEDVGRGDAAAPQTLPVMSLG